MFENKNKSCHDLNIACRYVLICTYNLDLWIDPIKKLVKLGQRLRTSKMARGKIMYSVVF